MTCPSGHVTGGVTHSPCSFMTCPSGHVTGGVTHSPCSFMTCPSGHVTGGVVPSQPVWAGLPTPTPLLLSHSKPLLGKVPSGSEVSWPGGFLLSACPTPPGKGLPVAAPFPLPFGDGLPSRVEQ